MADHFYAFNADGEVFTRDRQYVTVGTSTLAGSHIELRVTDAQVSAEQVNAFCEAFADWFAVRDQGIVSAGSLKA